MSEKSKVLRVAMPHVPGFGQNAAILSDKLCAGKMSVFTKNFGSEVPKTSKTQVRKFPKFRVNNETTMKTNGYV